MYVFSLHWTINWSSLTGRRSPLQLLAFQLPRVLCAVLIPCGLYPMHFGMSIVVVLVQFVFGQSHWWHFMGVASDITRRDNLTQIPWSSGSWNLVLSSVMFQKPIGAGVVFIDLSIGTGHCNSAFWLVVVFCNGFHLLQRKVSLMRVEDYTSLWVLGQVLRM